MSDSSKSLRALGVAIAEAARIGKVSPLEALETVFGGMPEEFVRALVSDGRFLYPIVPPLVDTSAGYGHDPKQPCWVRTGYGQKAHIDALCRTPAVCTPRWDFIKRVAAWIASKPSCPAKNSKRQPCGSPPWWNDLGNPKGWYCDSRPDHEQFIWGRDDYCRYHNDHDPSAQLPVRGKR